METNETIDTLIGWYGLKGLPDQNKSAKLTYKTNNEHGDIEESMTYYTEDAVIITRSEPIAAEDVDDFFAGGWTWEED